MSGEPNDKLASPNHARSTRYQKGKSGNPRGRPKKVASQLDPASILEMIDNEEIIVTDNGKRKRMPKAEIEFRQFFAKAIKGDLKAARLILKMATKYLTPANTQVYRNYEFIGVSEARQTFGPKWRERITKLNISRGHSI